MIYFLQRSDKTIKIGTTRDYEVRFSTLKVKYGECQMLGVMDGGLKEERGLHLRFTHLNTGKDGREWFSPADELIRFIETNTSPPPAPKPPRIVKGRQMTSRIPLTEDTHSILRDFTKGLDTSFDETILFLLSKAFPTDESPFLAGDRLRKEMLSKREELKSYVPRSKRLKQADT